MRQSFTESTEAVLHDSDPRLLNFLRLSLNPADMGGEGKIVSQLGASVSLPELALGASPSVTGPAINDLTGGGGNPMPAVTVGSYATRSAGQMHLELNFVGLGSFTFSMTAAQFSALATAQLGAGVLTGTVNLETFADLTPYVGKTIESTNFYVDSAFTTVLPGNVNLAASIFQPKILTGSYSSLSCDHDFTQGNTYSGTGLGINIGESALALTFTIVPVTGTFVNQVSMLLKPEVPIHSLVNSVAPNLGFGQLTYTFSDASTLVFHISTQMIKNYAAHVGASWNSSIVIDPTDSNFASAPLGPFDISSKSGLSITSIVWAGYLGYSAYPVDSNTSTGYNKLNYVITDGTNTITLDFTAGSYTGDPSPGPLAVTGSAQVFSVQFNPPNGFNMTDGSRVYPGAVNVGIPLDSATLISDILTPGMLTLQTGTSLVGNSILSDYAGFSIQWFAGDALGTPALWTSGGPALNSSCYMRLTIVSNGDEEELGHVNNIGIAPVTDWGDGAFPRTISTDARVQAYIFLYPTSAPAVIGSRVITEAYEIRQRNMPGFKLRFANAAGETLPNILVGALVSQGDPAVNQNNSHREWCPIPLDVIAATGALLDVAYPASVNPAQAMTDLPANYSGLALLVPKEYVGPWNYIRFTLSLVSQDDAAALAGITLEITANAREL